VFGHQPVYPMTKLTVLMLCFPTPWITLLCKKIFGAAIPMDYIFEFPFATSFFGSQTQVAGSKIN
jgi:hypothetical protein